MSLAPNTVRNLRQLLLDLYVTGCIGHEGLSDEEVFRVLDAVIDAAEGRPFELIELPLPREAH